MEGSSTLAPTNGQVYGRSPRGREQRYRVRNKMALTPNGNIADLLRLAHPGIRWAPSLAIVIEQERLLDALAKTGIRPRVAAAYLSQHRD
jgi:hypothetical protein